MATHDRGMRHLARRHRPPKGYDEDWTLVFMLAMLAIGGMVAAVASWALGV